jgi:ubiquinone/menaquinone biosynthesis C-methylase UbiE
MGRRITMHRLIALMIAALAIAPAAYAQEPDAAQITQERTSAEADAPKLAEVLGLKPGMAVADIGTGGGAMAVVLGKWIGTGHVYATDLDERALRTTREYAKKEGLTNVTVIEGGADRTNLPAACCDALFLRNVYHHVTEVQAFNKSLLASLKPGGRLAIIDFAARKGSPLPAGVPANREGHGVPSAVVIEEMTAAGFTYVRTIESWPPGEKNQNVFLALFVRK